MGSIEEAVLRVDTPVAELRNTKDAITQDNAALFPKQEHERIRNLVPVAARSDLTFCNAAYQHPMNVRVRTVLDEFLVQATTFSHPKPIWQNTTAESRTKLAQFLNVSADSIAFTRDTTEGLNLFQRSIKFSPGDNVVILDVEHPNHAYGWLSLGEHGLEVRLVPTEGSLFADAATFSPYIDEKTVAIGLSSVMFHSGQSNDVKDIAARFRPQGIHVLVDTTQHVGAGRVDLADWNVSAAAFGTHKALGCPTGLGALYIDPTVLPTLRSPPIVGAGAIANLSADLVAKPDIVYHGTVQRYEHLNVSLVSTTALKAALSLIADEMGIDRVERHLRALGHELAREIGALGLHLVGSMEPKKRAPHIYVLPLLHPDWQAHFAKEQVIVSHYRCGVRVSFGWFNNVRDVKGLVAAVKNGLDIGIPPC